MFPSPCTSVVASITNFELMAEVMKGANAVLHTATLHKPHLVTHTKGQFIETNVLGTQILIDAAVRQCVSAFIFTSTTSTFGHAMSPLSAGAVWVTEDLKPVPKNIYGVT